MSTRLDNNLDGPKLSDCEIKKTNELSDKQDNNQTSIDENIQPVETLILTPLTLFHKVLSHLKYLEVSSSISKT